MIARDQAVTSLMFDLLIAFQIFVKKIQNAPAALFMEKAVVSPIFCIPQKQIIAVARPVQAKIHMKSRRNRQPRSVPFGYERRFRIRLVQHLSDVLPDQARSALVFVVLFYERIRHIHPETVASGIQPETHNILQSFLRCGTGRIRDLFLPRLIRM